MLELSPTKAIASSISALIGYSQPSSVGEGDSEAVPLVAVVNIGAIVLISAAIVFLYAESICLCIYSLLTRIATIPKCVGIYQTTLSRLLMLELLFIAFFVFSGFGIIMMTLYLISFALHLPLIIEVCFVLCQAAGDMGFYAVVGAFFGFSLTSFYRMKVTLQTLAGTSTANPLASVAPAKPLTATPPIDMVVMAGIAVPMGIMGALSGGLTMFPTAQLVFSLILDMVIIVLIVALIFMHFTAGRTVRQAVLSNTISRVDGARLQWYLSAAQLGTTSYFFYIFTLLVAIFVALIFPFLNFIILLPPLSFVIHIHILVANVQRYPVAPVSAHVVDDAGEFTTEFGEDGLDREQTYRVQETVPEAPPAQPDSLYPTPGDGPYGTRPTPSPYGGDDQSGYLS